MSKKIVCVVFFRSAVGNEPVKDWLLTLNKGDRAEIGKDLKTVEYGWPLGMPLVRSMEGKNNKGLWEVRTNLSQGRIARVIFTLVEDKMVLLHGFIKKSQKTPVTELETARNRRVSLTHE